MITDMDRTFHPDDLLDSGQVAEMLGLSTFRAVSEYRRRYDTFPEPVIDRERCKLWARQDIEAWQAGRQ